MTVFHEANTFLNQSSKFSCFTPIWGNGVLDEGDTLKHWMDKGISKIKDLYNEGTLM